MGGRAVRSTDFRFLEDLLRIYPWFFWLPCCLQSHNVLTGFMNLLKSCAWNFQIGFPPGLNDENHTFTTLSLYNFCVSDPLFSCLHD